MATNLDHLADDVPLGPLGRLLGLRVVSPALQNGEEIRWSARANMVQHRVRAVGGRLYLTDRRLVFGRNRTESLLGGKEWSTALSALTSASEQGKRRIRVEDGTGRVECFLVGSPREAAEKIDTAVKGAS